MNMIGHKSPCKLNKFMSKIQTKNLEKHKLNGLLSIQRKQSMISYMKAKLRKVLLKHHLKKKNKRQVLIKNLSV